MDHRKCTTSFDSAKDVVSNLAFRSPSRYSPPDDTDEDRLHPWDALDNEAVLRLLYLFRFSLLDLGPCLSAEEWRVPKQSGRDEARGDEPS